jgi:hypothetical protein
VKLLFFLDGAAQGTHPTSQRHFHRTSSHCAFRRDAPVAKTLFGWLSPFMVAGFFYPGSGVGLDIAILVRQRVFIIYLLATDSGGRKIAQLSSTGLMPWIPAVVDLRIVSLPDRRTSALSSLSRRLASRQTVRVAVSFLVHPV